MGEMQFHPMNEMFPAMQKKEFTAPVGDSARSGLHEPIHVVKRRVTHYGVARFGEMGCEAVVLDDGSRGYLRRQLAQLIGLHSKNPSSRFAQICVDFAPKSLSLLEKSDSQILMPHGGVAQFFTVLNVPTSPRLKAMIDPKKHEVQALAAASRGAGEYIESLAKTDLATFTGEEWATLIEVAVTAFQDHLRTAYANEPPPF